MSHELEMVLRDEHKLFATHPGPVRRRGDTPESVLADMVRDMDSDDAMKFAASCARSALQRARRHGLVNNSRIDHLLSAAGPASDAIEELESIRRFYNASFVVVGNDGYALYESHYTRDTVMHTLDAVREALAGDAFGAAIAEVRASNGVLTVRDQIRRMRDEAGLGA